MSTSSPQGRTCFDDSDGDAEQVSAYSAADMGGLALPPLPVGAPRKSSSAEIISGVFRELALPAVPQGSGAFGIILRPQGSSLWDHKCALSQSEGRSSIRFSPENYPLFDRVLVQAAAPEADGSVHPAFNSHHPRFRMYAPLRRNLAILRNFLMLRYPPESEQAEANRTALKAMATRLGNALRTREHAGSEKLLAGILHALRQLLAGRKLPPRGHNHFLALANVPDRGIAFMYEYVRREQPLAASVASMPAAAPKDALLLPPLTQSPFSGENMAEHSDAAMMAQVSAALEIVTQMRSVGEMQERDREISVEHARDILRNMRIIATGTQEEKTVDSIDGRAQEARSMLEIALYYERTLAELQASDPEIAHEPLLREAAQAFRKILPRVKSEQKIMEREERREAAAPAAPSGSSQNNNQSPVRQSRSQKPKKEPIGQLLQKLEYGINRTAEIRKKSLVKALKQKSPVAEAIGNYKVLNDGMTTMSGHKIHQVSVNDKELIQTIRKINEPPEPEPQKETGGNPSITGRR